jgi:hypothetical protein
MRWPWQKKADKKPLDGPAREFNPERVDAAYQELVQVFNKHQLTTGEIIIAYGNLGYTLGASIEGYQEGKGPTITELQKMYYQSPTLGVAMMIQGYTCTSWYEDWAKTVKSSEEK